MGLPLRPLLSTPLLLGIPGGIAMQLGLKTARVDATGRITVQVASIGISMLGMCLYPPGGPDTTANWMWFIGCGTGFVLGCFGLLMGAIVDTYGLVAFSSVAMITFAVAYLGRFCWILSRTRFRPTASLE